jgi:hypothetical protein
MNLQLKNISVEQNDAYLTPSSVEKNIFVTGQASSVNDVFESLRKLSTRNHCITSIKNLVKTSGYSTRSVQRALRKLEDMNYIQIKPRVNSYGGNVTNSYRILRS